MKEDKSEKKMATGCFVVVAIFFMILAIYQCSAEQQTKQTIKHSSPILQRTDTIRHKTKTTISIPANDEKSDADLYDNPDFDDLIPGEEYDEEFVDRDEGDPELYN